MLPRPVKWAAAVAAVILLATPLGARFDNSLLSGDPAWVLVDGQQTGQAQQQQQPPPTQQPVFRSEVDLVRVDVQIVDGKGDPVLGLGVDDFQAWLDGRERRVASAELVSFSHEPLPNLTGPLRSPGFIPDDSRVFIIAVDQLGLPPASVMPMKEAMRKFFRQLRPQDMVGLFEFPYRTKGLDISHDHTNVGRTLDRVIGMRELNMGSFNLAPSEIVDIAANDADVFAKVVSRECDDPAIDFGCPEMVRVEARGLAGFLEAEAASRMNELARLAQSLAYIQGRKTIVLLSGGLVSSQRPGGRPDVRTMMATVGDDIANAQASLYVLHLDSAFMDAYSASARTSRRASDRFENMSADRFVLTAGLELLAGRAGGTIFSVEAGTPEFVFDRVLRETKAYYVIGVEPSDDDRDGRSHYIRVRTTAKGATVRSRVQVTIPKKK